MMRFHVWQHVWIVVLFTEIRSTETEKISVLWDVFEVCMGHPTEDIQ